MAERISWSSFRSSSPRLRDHDNFNVSDRMGTPGQLRLTMTTAPNVTWWKALKVLDRRTGRIIREVTFDGPRHGPQTLIITAVEADFGVKIVFAKAKMFGVHTDMYEIYEVSDQLGRHWSFTWLTDGPDNVFGAIGSFVSDVVNGVGQAVATVARAVGTVIEGIGKVIGDAVAWVVGLIQSIPVIGRIITWVMNIVSYIFGWASNAVAELAYWIAGVIGRKPPQKILRLQVVIQRDELNRPIVNVNHVRRQLEFLIKLFIERVNVKVIPVKPFGFTSKFGSDPPPVEEFITVLDRPSSKDTLDVCCTSCAAAADLGTVGTRFQLMINNLFWGGTRRLIGYGGALVVFAVRRFTDGKAGCSLGPLANYITIMFRNPMTNNDTQYSLLAHEVGHSCTLLHSGDTSNLMFETSPNPEPWGDLNRWLSDVQVFGIRTSNRVAFV